MELKDVGVKIRLGKNGRSLEAYTPRGEKINLVKSIEVYSEAGSFPRCTINLIADISELEVDQLTLLKIKDEENKYIVAHDSMIK